MDTPNEDTMVRQIEKNLSDNMSENLFLTGRIPESRPIVRKQFEPDKSTEATVIEEANREYPLVSYDYINNSPGLSRAEYIKQAREACLRQLSAVQIYSKPYEVNYMETETAAEDNINQKQDKAMLQLEDNIPKENKKPSKNVVHDMISYRSLIIRSACAITVFLSAFLLDKFNVEFGSFSHKIIQEYVTGNDALQQLENILVTWLK